MHYYNEWDLFNAEWLQVLMDNSYIPRGHIDTRDIRHVKASDLLGYKQCHFFAGIGGWPLALRLAGWPDHIPVWTASLPCQPFSSAGLQEGFQDDRDLWPTFFNFVKEHRPPTIFGEQVAEAIKFGWLDRVLADLGSENYTGWPIVFGAHSVGSPTKRQRLYWLGHSECEGLERYTGNVYIDNLTGWQPTESARSVTTAGVPTNFWADYETLVFESGIRRRIGPGIAPMANGLPAWMGRLRGYGNAIVPQAAVQVIQSYMEAVTDESGR